MTRRNGRSAREFRRGSSRVATLLVALVVVGCNLLSPTSPNDPGNLTGQNANAAFSFSGTVSISLPSSVSADGVSEGVITVTVLDDDGRPVANLTPVTISTTIGLVRVPGTDPATASTAVSVPTFNGIAQALISSVLGGNGTVLAAVGDVVSSRTIRFDIVPIKGSLSVFFRIGGEDLFNVFGTSAVTDPFRAGIVAVAVDDETGAPLAGVLIRFRIINDTTGFVAGVDKARLEGEETTFTNTAGEAFNQLRIVGVGEVVIEADLIDPNTNEVVETSNQIIAVTINIPIITLAFGGGATTTVIGPGGTATVTATVTDTTGMPISGAIVRFNITSDSTGGAVLSRMTAATGAAGTASITVTNGPTSPGTVMIEGEVIDSGGVVLATSNTITGSQT